jgi:hypothetical protein
MHQFKVTDQERRSIEKDATEEGPTGSKYVRGSVLLSMVMDGQAGVIKIVALITPVMPDAGPLLPIMATASTIAIPLQSLLH